MAKADANQSTVERDGVLTQLKMANRLLAAQLRRRSADPLTQQEIVKLLAPTGASTQEIAGVLDTSPNTVRKAQLRLRSGR